MLDWFLLETAIVLTMVKPVLHSRLHSREGAFDGLA